MIKAVEIVRNQNTIVLFLQGDSLEEQKKALRNLIATFRYAKNTEYSESEKELILEKAEDNYRSISGSIKKIEKNLRVEKRQTKIRTLS